MAEHAAVLAHQFDDLTQQYASANLGMWLFLLTEIMFFGGLFTGYTVYRIAYPAAFSAGSHHLDIVLGGINTAVLHRQQSDHGPGRTCGADRCAAAPGGLFIAHHTAGGGIPRH